MKNIISIIKLMRRKEKSIFFALLATMVLAPIFLNFSYICFRNYDNANLVKYLDLHDLEIQLNESLRKQQLEECLKEFSDDLCKEISSIILSVEIEDVEDPVICGFCYQDSHYSQNKEWNDNLVNNNFVSSYFSEEQEQNGDPVILAPMLPDDNSWEEAASHYENVYVTLQGRKYEIIGYQNWTSGYMVPYASLDDTTMIISQNGILISFQDAITESQYGEISDIMKSILGEKIRIPDIEFTNSQKDGINNSVIAVAVFVAFIFSLDLMLLFQFVQEGMKTEDEIYHLCGLSVRKIYIYHIVSILILILVFYGFGQAIYFFWIRRCLLKIFAHITLGMINKAMFPIFLIYLVLVLFFVSVSFWRSRIRDWKEVHI